MRRAPVAHPKLPCVGGPLDGRVVSELDLTSGASIFIKATGPLECTLRRDSYERAIIAGRSVWRWRERND